MTNVSTYALHQSTLRDAASVQATLATLQQQVSSGQKSQNFAGLGEGVEQYLSLETKISRSQQYIDNNNTIKTRIAATGKALDDIINTASNLKSLIQSARTSSEREGMAFREQINAAWQALAGHLNTSSEGRFLFAGSATDTPAVRTDLFPQTKEPGVPDESYYQGNSQDLFVQPQDNVTIKYNVRANDPAFQKIFAGLALADDAFTSNLDSDYTKAYDLVNEGLKGVIGIQATVNANSVAIDSINQGHNSQNLYLRGIVEEIGNADILGASTQISINQGILQASFRSFSILSQLRLSDFLKG
jgi:flagellar hook-associated protein 3 FlgL